MKHRFVNLALGMGLMFGVGCAPTAVNPGPTEPSVPGAPPMRDTATPDALSTPLEVTPMSEESYPPSESGYPVPAIPTLPGEYPAEGATAPADSPAAAVPPKILDVAMDDLVAQTGADPAAVTVVSAEQVAWPDGSLGCPQPDMMYTQAIVEGYRLILEVDGQTYDYHFSDAGTFVLCDIPLLDDDGY
jgi:hypothetical protein